MVSDYRDPEERLQRAAERFHVGRVPEAHEELLALEALGYRSAEVYLYLGHCALEQNQLIDAAKRYRRAHQIAPERPEPYLGLGVLAGRRLRFERAVRYLTRAAALHPPLQEIHDNLILCYGALGDMVLARRSFDAAIRLDAESPHAYYNLAFLHFENGAPHLARELWNQVRGLAPDYPDVERLLANCERMLGNFEEARKRLETVLSRDPRDAEALADLGLAHESRDEWQSALHAYRRVLEVDPIRPRVRARVGDLLRKHADAEEGLSELRRAGSEDAGDPDVAEPLARALLEEGLPDQALSYLRAAVLGGDEAAGRATRGKFWFETGRPVRAAVEFRKLSRLEPDVAVHRLALAHAYLRAGRSDRAEDVLRAATRQWPGEVELARALAELRLRAGDARSALSVLREGLRHRPGHPQLLLGMGESYLRLGRIAQAIAHAAKVRREDGGPRPDDESSGVNRPATDDGGWPSERRAVDHQSVDLLGRAYLALGDHTRALELADQLLKGQPEDVRAVILRARALFAAGDPERAASDYRRYVRARPGDPSGYREFARCLEHLGRGDEAEQQSRIGAFLEQAE